ncbi:ATP-binding protein [Streptoalloteichus hindustanus]|uniref:Histidine kinase-like ATPase domain-containing protein n=1 Tax=Streptoalloteichus hindustanus TaxID=2017 RepID=A0A1M4Y9L9_STRHI|nr:ATP-binding protein [Streptoalloteichus hindustanus]SHF02318.1 Histidine kinase-like ATPase domain-containing protein [Streptoalloteichus hindustanus]
MTELRRPAPALARIPLVDGIPPLRQLREFATVRLAGAPPELVQDVHLVLTELVTNAYLHASAPRSVGLGRLGDGAGVRVEVSDGSAAPPSVQPFSSTRLGGRGMRIVDQLADEWGVLHSDGGGKTVWAVIRGAASARGRVGGASDSSRPGDPPAPGAPLSTEE